MVARQTTPVGRLNRRERALTPSAPPERLAARRVGWWLIACSLLVFAMVVLGGVTRLTGSGLSMVDWDPVMGAVPPLSFADWQHAFDQYKQFPEYRLKNHGMSLAEFQVIYAFEYAHRMLGRFIGLAFFLPLAYFALRRQIPAGMGSRLVTLLLLGGAQGFLGWFMVESGLSDVPHVSHYRLTAHLLLAVAIYAVMTWTAFSLLQPGARAAPGSGLLRRLGGLMLVLVFVTLGSGGLVAGLKAGLSYNTFPLMAESLVPEGLFNLTPWWSNFFDNGTLVQFDHRVLGIAVAGTGLVLWATTLRRPAEAPPALRAHLLLAAVAVQVALGISTLVLRVPVALAAAHQGGGLLVLTGVLWYLHGLRRGRVPALTRPAAACDRATSQRADSRDGAHCPEPRRRCARRSATA